MKDFPKLVRLSEESDGGARLVVETCFVTTQTNELRCEPTTVFRPMGERTATGFQGTVESVRECGCTNICWVNLSVTKYTAARSGDGIELRSVTNQGRITNKTFPAAGCIERTFGIAFDDPGLDERCVSSIIVQARRTNR